MPKENAFTTKQKALAQDIADASEADQRLTPDQRVDSNQRKQSVAQRARENRKASRQPKR
jgi:hypothetical protein